MIIEAIFNVIAFLLLGVIGLFPTIPQIDTSFMDGFVKAVSLVDTFVSLRILSACLVAFFIFANIRVVWSIIMWVVRKIPGIE